MTTSTRERVLNALHLWLQNTIPAASVKRNETLPMKVAETGMMILRDGQIGEPEIILSPTRYIYRHHAELEVIVQQGGQAERDLQLDGLLLVVGAALDLDPTLGGLVDYLSIGSPALMEERIEGAPTLKAAVVPIILEYSTLNPLT